MKFRGLKKSMLFSAIEYNSVQTDMQNLYTINSQTQVRPESDILTFYLANHLLALIEDKVGENVLSESEEELCLHLLADMELVFKRMFTYLVLISIGETRHGNTEAKKTAIIDLFGDDVWGLSHSIKGTNRSGARGSFLASNRNLPLFMGYCNWCFVNCFSGGSFGGKKWKDISDKCVQMLLGKISPFTMTDVSWAMVHNTGSIFNKNTVYHNIYSTTGLSELLDMQRAGAIPAFIMNKNKYIHQGCSFTPIDVAPECASRIEAVEAVFGIEDIGSFVSKIEIAKAGAMSYNFKQALTKQVVPTEEPTLVNSGDTFYIGESGYDVMERKT